MGGSESKSETKSTTTTTQTVTAGRDIGLTGQQAVDALAIGASLTNNLAIIGQNLAAMGAKYGQAAIESSESVSQNLINTTSDTIDNLSKNATDPAQLADILQTVIIGIVVSLIVWSVTK